MARESGFYWIQYSFDEEWEPARYEAMEELWHIIDLPVPAQESELTKINEERILPPNA